MHDIILTPPKRLSHWLQLYVLYRRSFPRAERKPFLTILKNTGQIPQTSGASAGMTGSWASPPP